MIRPRARRRLAAWLAWAALWLIVAAPVISQALAAPSATARAAHCGDAMEHGGGDPLAPPMDKCGYCGLLGHSPVLGSVPWLPVVTPWWPAPPEAVLSAPRHARTQVLAAAPRGPPARAHA